MASPITERQASVGESTKEEVVKREYESTPPTQKSSEAAAGTHERERKRRRKVNHACVYCRRSHMTCDLQRPCTRCVKRDIGHLCHDEPRDPPKRKQSEAVADLAPALLEEDSDVITASTHGRDGSMQYNTPGSSRELVPIDPGAPQIAQPSPISPTQSILQGPLNAKGRANRAPSFGWPKNGTNGQFREMHHLLPNYMFNTSEATNEYNLLNDFLSSSLLDDGALYGGSDDSQALFNDFLLATSSMDTLSYSVQNQQPPPPPAPPPPTGDSTSAAPSSPLPARVGQEISRPPSAFPISDKARDTFYMTAADPAGLSSAEDRLHKLLQAKYDAGMLKPFNYARSYARLNAYLSRHLARDSQLRILRQLDRFRPAFRAAMQGLTDMQLLLAEMWVERSLMEYDRVFASMAVPACCWRRTGELVRGNREMAELVGVPMDRLRDARLALHHILAPDSLVSYWEKFGAIAFDHTQKAILTSCWLRSPPAPTLEPGAVGADADAAKAPPPDSVAPGETVRCCFSFTIRRDSHNIPSLIVGNFLPIRPREPK